MGKSVNVFGFPNLDPAEDIKTALESYTGIGTIHALEVKKSKGGPAKVQFTTRERVDYILDLANEKRLWYDDSYLLAWESDYDIERKPKEFAFDMEVATLRFGCQISNDTLSVLCEMRNTSVKFGFGLRNLYFVIPYSTTSYKLQLRYENIWQVQLHRSRGLSASYLVIQVTKRTKELDVLARCWTLTMDP